LLPDVAISRVGKSPIRFRVLFVLRKNLHDFVRAGVAGGREEHRVDETEDSRVRADPEGEDDDSRNGETRRLDQLPDREFKILDHMRLPVRCQPSAIWIQKSKGRQLSTA